MLSFEMNGSVLPVTETLHSFRGTTESHWYYDVNLWHKSSTGKLNSRPDREMTESDIAWVKKHYLPHVGR